ncbi:hypothetical protein BH20ACT10_BH20ACT10_02440 [soil metagenome]
MRSRLAEYIRRMLGVGGSEIIIIGLLFLLIFGPSKLPQMARDIGKFVGQARRSIDEFKDELTMEPDPDEKPARRRESRNGSKKSTKSAKPSQSFENEKDESSELSNEPGDPEAAEGAEEAESEESSPRAASPTNSQKASQTSKAKEEESGLRDL